MNKKIIILGGGLSGLAAGEILSKHFKVNIFESESYLGGLASTFEHNHRHIPKYYHHIIKSNKYTIKYLNKFCKSKLDWKKINVAIGKSGKLSIINKPLELLGFRYLNLYEKIRFGLFGIYSLYLMNPNKISEDMDAETWLKKCVGKNVTNKIFYHLYSKNKFNIPLNQISAKQFANRLYEKEIQDYFSFPEQGYQGMIEGLKKSIEKQKGFTKMDSKITLINLEKKYIIEAGKKIKYDILINTIPFEIFLRLAKDVPAKLKTNLSKIRYCPAVGLCFGTADFLQKDLYWINLFDERIHTIMQHSVLCDNYEDKINWCLKYGGSEKDLKLNEEEIKREYLKDVGKYFPKAKIKWAKVFRTEYGEPIYDIKYHKYMPSYKTPVDGLYFAGIQMTYPRIRTMNVALKSGIKVAEIILQDLKETS